MKLKLFELFRGVKDKLAAARDLLNLADEVNQNHGDNMVELFGTITSVMEAMQGSSQSEQLLASAEKLLSSQPGETARTYAEGLKNAARLFAGEEITGGGGVDFIKALFSSGKISTKDEETSTGGLDEMLEALGRLEGAGADDLGGLMSLGMSFLEMEGKDMDADLEAFAESIISPEMFGGVPHRLKSGKLVASTLMELVNALKE